MLFGRIGTFRQRRLEEAHCGIPTSSLHSLNDESRTLFPQVAACQVSGHRSNYHTAPPTPHAAMLDIIMEDDSQEKCHDCELENKAQAQKKVCVWGGGGSYSKLTDKGVLRRAAAGDSHG